MSELAASDLRHRKPETNINSTISIVHDASDSPTCPTSRVRLEEYWKKKFEILQTNYDDVKERMAPFKEKVVERLPERRTVLKSIVYAVIVLVTVNTIFNALTWIDSDDHDPQQLLQSPKDYCMLDYNFSRDGLIKTPVLKKLPQDQEPVLQWTLQQISLKGFIGVVVIRDTLKNILSHHNEGSKSDKKSLTAKSIYEYVGLLEDKEHDVSTCRVAELSRTAFSDEDFSEYRLSGPNPTSIKLATMDDLETLKCFDTDRLVERLHQHKLFVVDYSQLANLNASREEIKGFPKNIMGSIALFEESHRSLHPVCIKILGFKPTYVPESSRLSVTINRPSYTDNYTPDYKWEIAKSIFQSNDVSHHEFFAHLSATHLVEEIFMIATYRRFPRNHPLFKLLTPHFEGTAYINNNAIEVLIVDNGILEKYFPGEMKHMRVLAQEYVENVTANDMRFPQRLEARRIDVKNAPTLRYAYRDDGMLLWDAIHKWVTEYIHIFYKTNEEVADDPAIHLWIQDLVDKEGGNVQWLAKFQFTLEWLSDVITSVIFIGSVDHAAVNFPQRTHMQFAPAFPAAIYGKMDILFKDEVTEEDYLSFLPPLPAARSQAQVTTFLGGLRYTKLGHYEHIIPIPDFITSISETVTLIKPKPKASHIFKGIASKEKNYHHKVVNAMKNFQHELDDITKIIEARNAHRSDKYYVLLPKNIPQSINI